MDRNPFSPHLGLGVPTDRGARQAQKNRQCLYGGRSMGMVVCHGGHFGPRLWASVVLPVN